MLVSSGVRPPAPGRRRWSVLSLPGGPPDPSAQLPRTRWPTSAHFSTCPPRTHAREHEPASVHVFVCVLSASTSARPQVSRGPGGTRRCSQVDADNVE